MIDVKVRATSSILSGRSKPFLDDGLFSCATMAMFSCEEWNAAGGQHLYRLHLT